MMPENEYYKSLPKKRMACGAIFLNEKGEILLVKPNYKDHWLVVGGVVELDESPRSACFREVKEEIGIELKEARFLCVDYIPDHDEKGEYFHFSFFGGLLTEVEIAAIAIDESELIEFRFMGIEDAARSVTKTMAARLPICLEAIQNHTGVYLEEGA